MTSTPATGTTVWYRNTDRWSLCRCGIEASAPRASLSSTKGAGTNAPDAAAVAATRRRGAPRRGGDGVARACSRCVEAFDRVVFAQDYHPAGHESFASEHAGKAPYDEVELAYGTQTLWPDHCVQGTWGCAFHDDLVVPARAMVVRKGHNRDVDSYSAFFENDRRSDTGLDEYLKREGVKRVYVVGLAYDFCVKYTALDAKRLGYDAYVVRDCCAGVALPGTMEAAEKELADAGVVVLETLPA